MMHLVKKVSYVLLLCLLGVSSAYAKELISPQCEPLEENLSAVEEIKHSQGILWKISKKGKETNYLFGTIHVSDVEITTLPEQVNTALNDSKQFVMEALPDMEQLMLFSQTMFFNDGTLLSALVEKSIYESTKQILASYQLGSDAVSVMKPWAAFLVMNYPPDKGEPLDMVLLSLAQQNGAKVAGLETLKEQGELFSELTIPEQVKLLTDTVCHYELVEQDFQKMKSFYLKRDLGGLYNYVQRYTVNEKPVYKKLMKKLIQDRNIIMAKRMRRMLEEGSAFIAVGAMHLAGKDGVLALLEKQGYSVSVVY
jgi:uncharacterized protein YbaP (TraB family)